MKIFLLTKPQIFLILTRVPIKWILAASTRKLTSTNKETELHSDKVKKDSYNLKGQKKVIVFNQEKFESRFQMPERLGTQHDVKSIKKTFKSIGWLVKVYNDLTVSGKPSKKPKKV